jgi:conjugal transfer mating pair stabilization protein TraN
VSGNGCVKTETTPFIINFNCPAGFARTQLTAQKVICSKQETVAGTVRTGCPAGFSASGSSCVRSQPATASTSYSCSPPYSRSGTTCTRDRLVSCPNGFNFDGQNSCIATASFITVRDYYCRSGYLLVGTRCAGQDVLIQFSYAAPFETRRTCPAGFSNTGSSCRATRTPTFTCPNGNNRVGSGSTMKCTVSASASTSYSCPAGFSRSGTTCTTSSALNYGCDAGFALSGTSCSRIAISNQDASQQNTCPANFNASSSDCQREARVPATQALSCAAGLTREGNQCTKINGGRTVSAPPTVSTSCAAGFTQVGTGNTAKCEKRELLTSQREQQQRCEDGWSKRIVGATIDCVRTS